MKQKLGGLPNLRNPLKTHIKLSVVLHIASSEKVVFFDWTTPIWRNKPQSGETSESKHQDFRPFAEAIPIWGNRATPTLSQSRGKLGKVHNGVSRKVPQSSETGA